TSPATCSNSVAAKPRAARARTRSRCSSRSAPRSRISRQPCWSGSGSGQTKAPRQGRTRPNDGLNGPQMPVLIKICGLRTPETLDAALQAGADMVGFVFFPPSPRHLASAAAVRQRALKAPRRGDAPEGGLAALAEATETHFRQLRGRATPDRVSGTR